MRFPATERELVHAALCLVAALFLCAGPTFGLARPAYADDEQRKAKEAELAQTAAEIQAMPAGPARQDAEAAFRNTVDQARLDYGVKTPQEYAYDQAKEKYDQIDTEWQSKYVNLPIGDPTRQKFFNEQWLPASHAKNDLEPPARAAGGDRAGTFIDPDLPKKMIEQGDREHKEKQAKEEAETQAKDKSDITAAEDIGLLLPEKPPPPKDPEDADGKTDGTFLENIGVAPADTSSQSTQPATTGPPVAGPQVAPPGPVKPPESVAPPKPQEDSMVPPDVPVAPTGIARAAAECASLGLGLTADQCAKILTGDVTNPDQQASTCLNEAAIIAGIPFADALRACDKLLSPAAQAPPAPALAAGPQEICPTVRVPIPGLMAVLWLDPCDTQGSSTELPLPSDAPVTTELVTAGGPPPPVEEPPSIPSVTKALVEDQEDRDDEERAERKKKEKEEQDKKEEDGHKDKDKAKKDKESGGHKGCKC